MEYLSARKWIKPTEVALSVGRAPKYELLAPKFLALKQNGASVQAIASAHGMSWQYANEIVRFAETGERPQWKAGKRTGRGPASKKTMYKDIAPLVAELLDDKRMTVAQARQALRDEHGVKVQAATIRRAYFHARPDLAREACEHGKRLGGRKWTFLGPEKHERIENSCGRARRHKKWRGKSDAE